jgi:chromosomal replication initiation ATPase DnaA
MTPEQLLADLGRALGVTTAQLRSRSRKRHIAQARQAACWALHAAYPKLSQQSIGDLLGGLDHATVRDAIERVRVRLAEDTALCMQLSAALPSLFQPPPHTVTIPPAMAFWAALGRKDWTVAAA